ncbi:MULTISPECIES: BolA family transcriptional regulator [unclassified Acinetobacter]|uniref:BolA family protein n=1 Tax=unclassified Acinetobacter TaxID=196816 RepID=UPI0015D17090|nr:MULTISPECIES: BolA family protein [unclassified Acinetobacter]UUS57530.1 BolA family transcriptional regulator [Acinetobacter sp. YH16040_T]
MSLEQQLIERLQTLAPTHLEVVNESAGHGGYFPGKESHFKAVIVSEAFAGLRLVQRHQKVYAAAGDLLSPGQIHALAIHAFLPEEWKGQDITSPECAHAPKSS